MVAAHPPVPVLPWVGYADSYQHLTAVFHPGGLSVYLDPVNSYLGGLGSPPPLDPPSKLHHLSHYEGL